MRNYNSRFRLLNKKKKEILKQIIPHVHPPHKQVHVL